MNVGIKTLKSAPDLRGFGKRNTESLLTRGNNIAHAFRRSRFKHRGVCTYTLFRRLDRFRIGIPRVTFKSKNTLLYDYTEVGLQLTVFYRGDYSGLSGLLVTCTNSRTWEMVEEVFSFE